MKNLDGTNAVRGPTAASLTATVGPALGASPPRRSDVPSFRSADLFGLATEIEIEHGDSRYRLRKTLLGKLIMTK